MPHRGGRWLLAAVVTAAALAACNVDSLLNVKVPSRVPVSLFDNPANAALMVNSAIADFDCAVGVFDLVEGVISDELGDAQLGAAGWDYDRRSANTNTAGLYGTGTCTNNQLPGIYTPLSTARWSAENALKKLQGWTNAQVVGRDTLIATAALYTGFSYALMGMAMCEAAFDLGKPINQMQMFAVAEQNFTLAITQATTTGQTDVLNAAYIGRARVRLYQGNTAGAAADAAKVPPGFVMYAAMGASDNRLYNRVFAATKQFGFYTIEPQSRNLTVIETFSPKTDTMPDPRTAVYSTGARGADAQIVWAARKYSSDATPIPVARYEEAQLILAEVAGGAQAVTIINNLRTAEGLPLYTGPTDAASVMHLIIEERRRELFLEGFRNYDIQRFKIPFNPPVGAPYPNKGGSYGNTTCLPLPDIERYNNPNATNG